MTYLYFLTSRGLTLDMCNAIPVLTASNEKKSVLQNLSDLFFVAIYFIFNSYKERELVEKVFPVTADKPNCVVGCGEEQPTDPFTDNQKAISSYRQIHHPCRRDRDHKVLLCHAQILSRVYEAESRQSHEGKQKIVWQI